MYTQLFGNYLLSKNIITPDQLVDAIRKRNDVFVQPNTIAMHFKLISATDAEYVTKIATDKDSDFISTAINLGYFTREAYDEVKDNTLPEYLFLGQSLINDGILSSSKLEEYIVEYQSNNEMIDLELYSDQKDNLDQLLLNLFIIANEELPLYIGKYINLLFTNLIQFIGEDFTPLNFLPCEEYPVSLCSYQRINGVHPLTMYLDLDEKVALEFASRYVGESFTEIDEYVKASLEDFLNLHNGIYNVNLSNESSIEMKLDPPVFIEDTSITPGEKEQLYMLPIVYPFGTINFLFEIEKQETTSLF
ncbi:MAG: chemotaxis protein CheX [Lachnospiraceae bacterium]|nr:chemotaxis protein CheX [Lachnospiraceae bacterium]